MDDFRQLYADGYLKIRSRFPNKTDDYQNNVLQGQWDKANKRLNITDLISVKNTKNMEVFFIEAWTSSIALVDSIVKNGTTSIVKFNEHNQALYFDKQKRSTEIPNPKCWIENGLELLDADNEWYFDKDSSTLYFKPSKNADINEMQFAVPQLQDIVNVENSKDIIFQNIAFEYANWNYPSFYGMSDVQGTNHAIIMQDGNVDWVMPPSNFSIKNSENIEISNCKFNGMGAIALGIYEECKNTLLYYNDFTNLSAGGILAGTFKPSQPIPSDLSIVDNVIENFGANYLGGIGVMVGYAKNLLIDHNEIKNGAYTGISVGWGWGESNKMDNYTITNNKVENIINNYLYDGAGLYALGTFSSDTTNIIRGNVFEGGNGYAGLYFDEKSNNYLATDNLIYKGNKTNTYLLMHDIDYGHKNIVAQHNFVETAKKNINSYDHKGNGKDKYYSTSSRNVIVKDNYHKAYKDWQSKADMIYNNAGRRK